MGVGKPAWGVRGHFVKIIIEECTSTPDWAWEDRGMLRKETIALKMDFKWNTEESKI